MEALGSEYSCGPRLKRDCSACTMTLLAGEKGGGGGGSNAEFDDDDDDDVFVGDSAEGEG